MAATLRVKMQYLESEGVEKFRCNRSDIKMRGEHNLANAMAVIIAAKINDTG